MHWDILPSGIRKSTCWVKPWENPLVWNPNWQNFIYWSNSTGNQFFFHDWTQAKNGNQTPPDEYCYEEGHCANAKRIKTSRAVLESGWDCRKSLLKDYFFFPQFFISIKHNLVAIRDGWCMRFNHPWPWATVCPCSWKTGDKLATSVFLRWTIPQQMTWSALSLSAL